MRSARPRVRLEPLIEGGRQERGLRSGTLNVPGIVGLARAVELCLEECRPSRQRLRGLRDRLFAGLSAALPECRSTGRACDRPICACRAI